MLAVLSERIRAGYMLLQLVRSCICTFAALGGALHHPMEMTDPMVTQNAGEIAEFLSAKLAGYRSDETSSIVGSHVDAHPSSVVYSGASLAV